MNTEECERINLDLKSLKTLYTMMCMNCESYLEYESQLEFDTLDEAKKALHEQNQIKWKYTNYAHNCILYTKSLKDVLFTIVLKHFPDKEKDIVKHVRETFSEADIQILAAIRDVIDHVHLIPAEYEIVEYNGKFYIKQKILISTKMYEKMNSTTKEKYNGIKKIDLSELLFNYINKMMDLFADIDEQIRILYNIPYSKQIIEEDDGTKRIIIGDINFKLKMTRDIDLDENGNPIAKNQKIEFVTKYEEDNAYPEELNKKLCQ